MTRKEMLVAFDGIKEGSCYHCNNCNDCNDCCHCYNCYRCNDCNHCNDCYHCYNCYNCHDCHDCHDCNDCNDFKPKAALLCKYMQSKKGGYWLLNKEVTEAEFNEAMLIFG